MYEKETSSHKWLKITLKFPQLEQFIIIIIIIIIVIIIITIIIITIIIITITIIIIYLLFRVFRVFPSKFCLCTDVFNWVKVIKWGKNKWRNACKRTLLVSPWKLTMKQ